MSSLARARAHNAFQPAGSLPTETLWEIFSWICPSGSLDSMRPNAPELTAVFTHWRHAALSYSPLWEDISVATHGPRSLGRIVHPPSRADHHRIEEHAKRANRNLNVRISCQPGRSIFELREHILRIFAYSGLFRHLEIDIPQLRDVPPGLFPLPKDLRNLVKLTVTVGTQFGRLDARILPSILQHGTTLRPVEVSLNGEFHPTLSLLDASSLQKAALTYLDLADVMDMRHLLRDAGSIRSLELRATSVIRETAVSIIDTESPADFVSPTLECLSVGRNWDTVSTLINPLTIRHLKLTGLASPPHTGSFAAFIWRFTALQSLCLSEISSCLPYHLIEEEHHQRCLLPSWLTGKRELVVLALPYSMFVLPGSTVALELALTCAPSNLPALRYVVIFDECEERSTPHPHGAIMLNVNDSGQFEIGRSSHSMWELIELKAKREIQAIRDCNPDLHVTYHRVDQPPPYGALPGHKNWDCRDTEAMRDVVRAHERGDMRWLGERGLLT